MKRQNAFQSLLRIACVLSVLLFGCGQEIQTSVTADKTICGTQQAEILVGDGYLHRACGCNEGDGTFLTTESMTCTVSSGTAMYFFYLGTHLKHQIVSIGTPSFVSSQVSDPTQEEFVTNYHAVVFSTAGSYQFQDQMMGGVGGTIVVQ